MSSLKIRFTNLSALQKFIRRNYSEWAIKVAGELKDSSSTMLHDRLYVIMFEDIGLANIPLLKEITNQMLSSSHAMILDDYAIIIKKMSNSYKSRLCSYLSYVFRDVFTYPESDVLIKNIESLYEPTPNHQYEMIDFSNPSYNLIRSIKLAGAMFIKGMDSQFWNLIYGDLGCDDIACNDIACNDNYQFARNLEKIAHNMTEHGGRGTAMVWICALIWKYLSTIGYDFPSNYELDGENETIVLKKLPDWIYDNHTSTGKQMGRDHEYFFKEGIKVNKLQELNILCSKIGTEEILANRVKEYKRNNMEPVKMQRSETCCRSSNYFYAKISDATCNIKTDKYQLKQLDLGDDTIPAKYTIDEILEFSTLKSKKNLHIADLGTIQIPYINKIGKRPYVLYCWLSLKPVNSETTSLVRYVLKPYSSKASALEASESDAMMHKYSYDVACSNNSWCFPSKVICINEIIEQSPDVDLYKSNGRIIDKKSYYTISPALPYFLPVTVGLTEWKKTPIMKTVILINILKYIFGIPDRTARNCGIYIVQTKNGRELRVCSFDHGPIMGEPKGPIHGKLGNIELKNLTDEKEWLFEISQDFEKKYYTRICEVITSM